MKTSMVRDLVSILVGAFGLIHSQLTGMVYPELIPVFGALLGAPLVGRLVERRKNQNGKEPPNE